MAEEELTLTTEPPDPTGATDRAEPSAPASLAALATALLEREALAVRVGGGSSLAGLLGEVDEQVLDGDGSTTPADVREAFGPVVDDARAAFAALLDDLDHPFTRVVTSCELNPAEAELLGVCVTIERDERLQGLVAHAVGDASQRRPTLGLIERMLGGPAVAAVSSDSRLRRAALVELSESGTFADAAVAVPRRAVWAVLGDRALDPDLPLGAEVVTVDPRMLGAHGLVLVAGEDRVRRVQAAVRALRGLAFLVVDQPTDARGWAALVRQAGVAGLGVVLEVGDGLTPLGRWWIERADHVAWALSSPQRLALGSLPDQRWTDVPVAPARVTEAEWRGVLGETDAAGRRLTAEQLQLVADAAESLGDPADALSRLADGPMAGSVRRITPTVTWEDLVVPPAHLDRLKELVARYRHRGTVFGEWGLAEMPSPGLVAMFGGPSGTGKTMTAEVMAADLGVDLFRVDLQAVVSKYIGETEKNLEQVFGAASAGDCVLLFDEADALFGTRAKVSDARDRYANLEVSFLLQRLETYDGFVVLTTNFQGNIDPAFMRRVHASIHFQMPSAAERLAIWQRALAKAPLADDVDLRLVADRFDLAGGAIRNAALTTAFLAADDRSTGGPGGDGQDHDPAREPTRGPTVRMEHLVRGLAAELAKLGRRPTPELFGPWHHLVPDVG